MRILAEVIWPRRYAILLTGLVFAGLAYGVSGAVPLHFASNGLLMVDAPDNGQDPEISRATDSDVLRSPSLMANVVDALGLGNRQDLVPRYRLPKVIGDRLKTSAAEPESDEERRLGALYYLERHLRVTGTFDSRVLSIDFDAGSPELAADVINELMRQYIDADNQAQRAHAMRVNGWLADQAKEAGREADAAEQSVLAFEAKNPGTSLQGGSGATDALNQELGQLSSAKQDVFQAQLDLETAKADGGQSEASSPMAQMLRQQETDVMQRLASARASMGNGNPERIALEDELQAVQRQIALENRNTVAARAQSLAVAKARLASVQAAIAQASDSAAQASQNQIELQHLMQVAQTERSTTNTLLDRLQTAELAANQATTARIVSPALPPLRPQASRRPVDVVMGLLTGMMLAAGYFLLRQLLNARIGSSMTLREFSGVPTIGTLPVLGSGRNSMARIAVDRPNCAVAETLRGIRLAASDMNTTTSGKVLLVSSPERGEGKTSVAAALSLRAADDGMRVLLIEGDLHRPRLAAELGLAKPVNGLEAVLSGGSYHGSLLQTHAASGLHCLLAAGSARNPIALLENKRFAKLIADARSIYDLIVIDSPPVLRVADAIVLSRSADQIVLVVRQDRMPRKGVIEAINRFPPDRQSLLVTLFIGKRAGRADAHGYYFGYENRPSSDGPRSRPAILPDEGAHDVVPQGRDLSANRL